MKHSDVPIEKRKNVSPLIISFIRFDIDMFEDGQRVSELNRKEKHWLNWTCYNHVPYNECILYTCVIMRDFIDFWQAIMSFVVLLFFFLSLLLHACICMSFRRHVNNLWIIWKYIGHRTTNKVFELSWFIKYIFYYVEATGRLYGDCLPLSPLLLCPSFLDVCGWWLCSSLVLTSSLPSPSTSSSRGK